MKHRAIDTKLHAADGRPDAADNRPDTIDNIFSRTDKEHRAADRRHVSTDGKLIPADKFAAAAGNALRLSYIRPNPPTRCTNVRRRSPSAMSRAEMVLGRSRSSVVGSLRIINSRSVSRNIAGDWRPARLVLGWRLKRQWLAGKAALRGAVPCGTVFQTLSRWQSAKTANFI
jgi:hypothetical protein